MNTIQQALELYKKELIEYAEWTNKMKKIYGEESNPMELWDTIDYNRIMSWNEVIQSIERILGLTEEEISKYCKEAGMS